MSITKLNNLSISAVTALPSGVGGKVLQVVQGTSSTDANTSSSTFVTTPLTASITPSSASSKILIIASWTMENDTSAAAFDFDRSGTLVSGASDGIFRQQGTGANHGMCMSFLDSPNTTSSRTYSLFYKRTSVGGTVYFVASPCKTSIILMEIGA